MPRRLFVPHPFHHNRRFGHANAMARLLPLADRYPMVRVYRHGGFVSTIYDWVTVALFAGLIVLFLQRSVAEKTDHDALWPYMVASIGCAFVNWLGNHGYHAFAVLLLIALFAFIHIVLRPFQRPKR